MSDDDTSKRKQMERWNEISGNLLEIDTDYIMQQCNCVTVHAHGLSKAIGDKFPECRVYEKRRCLANRNCAIVEDRATPGTFSITGRCINLFAQYRPGKPGVAYLKKAYPSNHSDAAADRMHWFAESLEQVGKHFCSPVTIAVPHQIGCGLAGGDWKLYKSMLLSFLEKHEHVTLYIVKLEE
jgi:hypothetical protein